MTTVSILGLRHVGLVCADAGLIADFYTRVLGLRPIPATGGADLCLGDALGRHGAILQFSARPDDPVGRRGVGATHHVALAVPDPAALRRWKRRLHDMGVQVTGPYERRYFQSIYFRDPDGIILELATWGPGWTVDEPADRLGTAVQVPPDPHVVGRRDEAAIAGDSWPDPVPVITPDMALIGLHHVTLICSQIERTADFYRELLGLRLLKRTYNFDNPRVPHWYLGPGAGEPGTVITYFGEGEIGTPPGRLGRGLTHHIAFNVAGAAALMQLRDRLQQAGVSVSSEVRDWGPEQAVRFADPDGQILEAATVSRS